jgi:hypothetical protein
MLAMSTMIYFWYKLTRIGDKVSNHKFFACTGTDAETIGRFDDSITRIGYATIYPGQTSHEVFGLYQEQLLDDCQRLGFQSLIVVAIGKREYDSLRRVEMAAMDDFWEALAEPAYSGKRMVKR